MTEGIATPDDPTSDSASVRIGPSFVGFRDEVVKAEARESVQESAVQVLQGALEAGPGSTGLVVGRVQSGKTLSYEGVIALARDNDFAIVVVIGGISNPLLAQGERRLRKDLGKADEDGWIFLLPADTRSAPDHVESELRRVSANWRNPSTPRSYRQTAIVVVLKNHSRIADLTDVFDRVDLDGLRVLIIDDEADQASLNTLGRRNRESTTYANLLALRDVLPHHYYLQYTATPQGNLLVAIQDALSPHFVRVLEPGAGYTGGDAYFGSGNEIVQAISNDDLAAAAIPDGPPPDGLRRAMQEFLVGAAHVAASGGRPETRSMLVHPSRQKDSQGTFARWIRNLRDNWEDKYNNADEIEPTKLKAEFEQAWVGLRRTYEGLSSFEECWANLGLVFRNLDITEVNTRLGQTPVIDWVSTKSYILIGGQAIDRGFTVEGLAVTYMPRGPGTFTADTIQQRARFFGYKSGYLGMCRVYLEQSVRDAFENYVEHERVMLISLRDIQYGEYSLKDWRRRFLLDPSMRPTRASVIGISTVRVNTSAKWISDRYPSREDAASLLDATATADELLDATSWPMDAYGNRVGKVTVRQALELLESVSPESLLVEPNFQALGLALARMADEKPDDPVVAVYWVRPEQTGDRTERPDGSIELYQGRAPAPGSYPGDRQVFDPEADLTVQLHRVRVLQGSGGPRGEYLLTAWRITDDSSRSWLVEVPS